MKAILVLCIGFLVSATCLAQHWRIEADAGIVVPTDLNPVKPIKSIPDPNPSYAPQSITTEFGTPQSMLGLKIMRRDSALDYGISVNTFQLYFKNRMEIDTSNGKTMPFGVSQSVYLGRPCIPIRGFVNYTHHLSKAYGFIGVSGGMIIARGRDIQDANQFLYYQDHTIYFHSKVGYMIGTQLGFRRVFGRFDAGLQLAANFIYLSLTQGPSNTPYEYNVIAFPVNTFLGFSF